MAATFGVSRASQQELHDQPVSRDRRLNCRSEPSRLLWSVVLCEQREHFSGSSSRPRRDCASLILGPPLAAGFKNRASWASCTCSRFQSAATTFPNEDERR